MSETVQYVDAGDGCKLWTATTGAGTPMVLCHGGPGMWDFLDPIAQSIDDLALVHRWDQRGGGRSDRRPPYTTERFVEDLDAVRGHFGHERWIVGGHSWGARLALEYALRYPERTRALVYISGTGIGMAWRNPYYTERHRRLMEAGAAARWLELLARERTPDEEREYCLLTWMTDYVDTTFGRERSQALLADGIVPNHEVNAALNAEHRVDREAEMIERCGKLDVPALIIHGDADPRPVSGVESLVAALPDARLAIIEGAGHLPWEEQPATFASPLREFVAGVG